MEVSDDKVVKFPGKGKAEEEDLEDFFAGFVSEDEDTLEQQANLMEFWDLVRGWIEGGDVQTIALVMIDQSENIHTLWPASGTVTQLMAAGAALNYRIQKYMESTETTEIKNGD